MNQTIKNWILGIIATVISFTVIGFGSYGISTVSSNNEKQLLLEKDQQFQKEQSNKNTSCCETNKQEINDLKACFKVIDNKLDNLQNTLERLQRLQR